MRTQLGSDSMIDACPTRSTVASPHHLVDYLSDRLWRKQADRGPHPVGFVPTDSLPVPSPEFDIVSILAEIRLARKLLLQCDLQEALKALDRAESGLADLPGAIPERVQADIDILHALNALLHDDAAKALQVASGIIHKQHTSRWAAVSAQLICSLSYWRLGNLAGVYGLPALMPASKRHSLSVVVGLCIDAAVEAENLRPSLSLRLALRALEEARRSGGTDSSSLCALPASLMAEALYEQGALDQSERLIREHLSAIQACELLEAPLRAYRILARIAAHRGRDTIALGILQDARARGESRDWPVLVAMALSESASLLAKVHRDIEARQYADRLDELASQCISRPGNVSQGVEHYARITRARLLLQNQPSPRGLAILQQLHDESLARRQLYTGLQIAVEVAGAWEKLGQQPEADEGLLRALSLGSFAGLHQTFIDRLDLIGPPLDRAATGAREPDSMARELLPYINGLSYGSRGRRSSAQTKGSSRAPSDALSVRECDILFLVCRGYSNKRIAYALTIAPETVKAHVKRIFLKLGVGSRAAAVYRAGALGLIQVGKEPCARSS